MWHYFTLYQNTDVAEIDYKLSLTQALKNNDQLTC